ncbi:MAG TPA: AAA family ATPase [Methylocella sp.]|nr:AAA family ATPase [Methylocella sp.]
MEPGLVTQDDVFAFLADPATHGLHGTVKRLDTHGAVVFLAGNNVYKIKRALRFPFMDYSTLAKRHWACAREVSVNQANAPQLYLGVVPIRQEGCALKLGGDGPVVEWAVHMRRFDEHKTFDHLAARHALPLDLLARTAETVAAAHRRAPVAVQGKVVEALHQPVEQTLAAFEEKPQVFAASDVEAFGQALRAAFSNGKLLMTEREAQGQVRRCHGDLHLRNIALIDDQPMLFDAIEFDETIATCDVLYDLAFLLMDLWTRGLQAETNFLFNRYLWLADDMTSMLKGLALMPFFLSLRAAIRAEVTVLQQGDSEAQSKEARAYFAAACNFLKPRPQYLVAIGGFSGTGKTTLAAALAPRIGRPTGAVHLRSDIERKVLMHVAPLQRLPDEAYGREISERVYQALRDLAAVALEAGQSAIVDAVHLNEVERLAIAEVAKQNQARFNGLWLEAAVDKLTKRVTERKGDASDATAAVVEAQATREKGPVRWRHLDATQSIDQLVEQVLAAIAP